MPDYRNWEGRQTAREDGDRIGMLLDLDQGSMTVYKNDERLGVMATGMSGEYSWAVGLQSDKRQGNRSLRASGDWQRRYDDAAALALGREGGCMLSRSGAVRRELHR